MKNRSFVYFWMFLFAVTTLTSSCQKEKEVVPATTGFNAEQILRNLQNENYASLEQIVLDLYNKEAGGGLKSVTADAKVAFSIPQNSSLPGPGSYHRIVFIWSLLQYNDLADQGVIVVTYNNQNQIQGDPAFFIGWNNEYCNEVIFTSNITPLAIKIDFDYPSTSATLSFQQYAYSWGDYYSLMLPQLDFNFGWEVLSNISFGGMGFFNPANVNNVYMKTGENFYINTKDYISFIPLVIINSKITMMVFDVNNEKQDLSVFKFPLGKPIPVEIIMPLTFTPLRIEYFISTVENDRWVDGPILYKNLYLSNPGGNPNMKIWKFQN